MSQLVREGLVTWGVLNADTAAVLPGSAPNNQRLGLACACPAGVDQLVASVRQLGTGAPVTATAAADSEAAPAVAAEQQVAEAAPPPPQADTAMMRAAGDANFEAAERPCAGNSEDVKPPPEGLPHSPTERLLGCQQRLQQRPLTAPGLSCHSPVRAPGLPRPTTGSPVKVKPLMQVGVLRGAAE